MQVGNAETVRPTFDAGVLSRDGDVVQLDVRLIAPADNDRRTQRDGIGHLAMHPHLAPDSSQPVARRRVRGGLHAKTQGDRTEPDAVTGFQLGAPGDLHIVNRRAVLASKVLDKPTILLEHQTAVAARNFRVPQDNVGFCRAADDARVGNLLGTWR